MSRRTDEMHMQSLGYGAELEILFVNNYAQIFLLSSIFIFNKYMHALNLHILLKVKIFLSPFHPPRDMTCPDSYPSFVACDSYPLESQLNFDLHSSNPSRQTCRAQFLAHLRLCSRKRLDARLRVTYCRRFKRAPTACSVRYILVRTLSYLHEM